MYKNKLIYKKKAWWVPWGWKNMGKLNFHFENGPPYSRIGLGSPKTNFQSYTPINDTWLSLFFGSMIMGKEPLQFVIFKNWLPFSGEYQANF